VGEHETPPVTSQNDERDQNLKKLKRLVISEDSVRWPLRRFVWSVLAFSFVWVSGGIAVPFVVGQAIPGVDPFQITTFMWVIAGFAILLAKSWLVSDWPWHDFLHSKVVCRSISEIEEVTGVDSQFILEFLMCNEYQDILRTKGPYNSMFTRKEDGGSGLSIDVPPCLSTMISSGFIILKVRNEIGEHLVCLDVRKGSRLAFAVSANTNKVLASKDISKDNSREQMNVATAASTVNLNAATAQLTAPRSNPRPSAQGANTAMSTARSNAKSQGPDHPRSNNKVPAGEVMYLREMEIMYSKVLGVYLDDSKCFG